MYDLCRNRIKQIKNNGEKLVLYILCQPPFPTPLLPSHHLHTRLLEPVSVQLWKSFQLK